MAYTIFIHLFLDNAEIVQLLIEKGANVNAVAKYNASALYFAAVNGNYINKCISSALESFVIGVSKKIKNLNRNFYSKQI